MDTSVQTGVQMGEPGVFPSGQEVYDMLMTPIDPELVSTNIDHLDEAYVNEQEADRAARYERYSAAFAKYDEAYTQWEAALQTQVGAYRRDALKSAEANSKEEDANVLSAIEENFDATVSTSA